MSGHRWHSIILLSLLTSLTGCQTDGLGKYAWNPFSKKPDASVAAKDDSSFSLPRFSSRKSSDTIGNNDAVAPMAAEQVERLLEQGQMALQNNRLDDAVKAYSEVLSASPDNATAHHGMAMAADLSEKWGDAEYHYRQALRIRPRDANLLCDIGYSYLLQNRYSEASRYLNHAVEINPQHENAQMNLALLDLKQGNRAAAEARITQRFGSSVKVSQILAQLESRAGTSATSAGPVPTDMPANPTLEQIQAIAAQERQEAERRRATKGVPQDPQPWATASNGSVPQTDLRSNPVTAPAVAGNPNAAQPVAYGWDGMNGTNPSVALSQPAMSQTQPVLNQPGSNQQGLAVVPNAVNRGLQNTVPANPTYAANNMNVTAPLSGNSLPTGSAVSGLGAMISQDAANPAAAAGGPGAGAPVPGASLGKVIPVHSSGAFQSPATNGVSYGQPVGFGVGGPTSQVSGASMTGHNTLPMQPNGAMGASTYPNYPGTNSSTPQPLQNASSAQQVYLEGLNVGPGALFPIGQATSEQIAAAAQMSDRSAAPINDNNILRTGNVSAPGTNSLINGAMYGQPQRTLPAQEWMRQQQQQGQQQSAVPQNSGMSPPGSAPTGWPSARPPESTPLDVYDRQLQQLDNTYNRTLQQMDRQAPQLQPRAQY